MMVGNSLDIFCLISTLISRFLGFDEMYPAGLWARNFEQLHYGITARMVWDHRHDFAMLAEILDMASNMMAASRTVLVIGPAWSSEEAKATMPQREQRP